MAQQISIPLGAWEPDKDGFDQGILVQARAAFPAGTPERPSWKPIPLFETVSSFTDALGDPLDPPQGLYLAVRPNGLVRVLAGTKDQMAQKVGAIWDPISAATPPSGTMPANLFWQFAEWGNYAYIGGYYDGVYKFNAETGLGALWTAVAGAPRPKYLAVFGSFLVAGQNKLLAADLDRITLTHSAIENPDGWTIGTDLCDSQAFPDGGDITGLASAGGQDGYVIQENKIRRAVFQPGSDYAFRFEVLEERKGAIKGYTCVSVAGTLFFLSNDGFYSFSPQQGLRAIGEKRVNEWFAAAVDPLRLDRTQAFVDTNSTRVGWAFIVPGAISYPRRIIYYDWQLDRWSFSHEDGYVFAAGQEGITAGGNVTEFASVAKINTSRQLSFQKGETGVEPEAQFETGRMHIYQGQRAFVSSVYPVGDFNGDTHTITVRKGENPSGSMTASSAVAPSAATGRAPFRAGGRIHDFALNVTTGVSDNWTSVESLLIDVVPDGKR